LVIITILYIKPKQFLVSLFKKETYIEFWAQVFNAEESKEHKAISIAFGVFMGIVPIWGFQLVAAIFLAVFFKLNRYLVILSANISLPPMIPAIIYLSYVTGSYFVDKPIQLAYHQNLSVAAIHQNFVQYFIGSWIFASVAAIVAGLVTYIMLHLYQRRNRLATTHG
jgi:uncharacterized protein (DUF2062 family)